MSKPNSASKSKSPSRSPPQPLICKRQLIFCLDKLLNCISRRYRDLRSKCIDYKNEIESLKKDPQNGDKYWIIFELCCQSQVPHIVEVSLDCIQKLMAASILTGQTKDKNGKPLIDSMVKTIWDCCAIESEKVQIQIVKAILTLCTSQTCEVHGQSLLMCLRACYNIFLSTKNIDVQTTSKAVLTQIVCAVFQRMEKVSQLSMRKQQCVDRKSEVHLMARSTVISLSNHVTQSMKHNILEYPKANTENDDNDNDDIDDAMDDNKENSIDDDDNNNKSEHKTQEKPEDVITPPNPQNPIEKANKKTDLTKGKFGWCVVCAAPASHYCIQTRDSVCSLDCKMFNLVNVITELSDLNAQNGIEETHANETIIRLKLAYKSTVLTNDGHILFRALCRQSLKTLPMDNITAKNTSNSWLDFRIPRLFDPQSQMKPLALKSKILSLELLRKVFSNTSHTFKNSHRFIDAVRECFVPVVAENAVSTVENIFQLAINMFCLLIENFRKYLKKEIAVLLDNVFLQIAESPHANFKQKKMALTVFNKICRDPQVLVGIFLNYDCGHDHHNIFIIL